MRAKPRITGSPSAGLSRDLQTLFEVGTAAGLSDRQLLDRFAGRRDPAAEAAFEVLVLRHGPMVLRVCNNVLPDPNDAHDAFQATFLVLVKRSGSLRGLDSIGGWLYGVACRVSARARVESARRRAVEGRAALRAVEAVDPSAEAELDRDEFGPIVQEEVRRLPEKYRAAVVLCYWDGLTHEQAAAQLGCPLGTIRSRLARARDLLRRRLARRGLEPLAIGMDSIRRLPPPAPELVRSTVQAAARVAAGQATNRVVSGATASLVQRALWRMTMIKIGGVAAGIVLIGLAGHGVRVGAQQPGSVKARADARTENEPAGGNRESSTVRFEEVYSRIEGRTTIVAVAPDGTAVKKGEVVCELDSSALRDALVNQRITTRNAEANFLNARLARENAERERKFYVHELFPGEEREAKGELEVADLELAVAQGQLVERKKELAGNGGLEIKRAELDVARARLAQEKARNRLHILTAYTKRKTLLSLSAEVQKSVSNELARSATWELEQLKEKKLESQIAACTIVAPIDGTVVHAESVWFDGADAKTAGRLVRVERGTTVRKQQLIFRIIPTTRNSPDQR